MKSNRYAAMQAFGILDLPIQDILDLALSHGGELAELFFENTQASRIVFEGGVVDRLIQGVDVGVGLRILFQGRSVYGYTTDLKEESLLALAQTLACAVPACKEAPRKTQPFEWKDPTPSHPQIQNYFIQKPPHEASLGEKIKLVQRADRAAHSVMPDLKQMSATLIDSLRHILIFNSDALCAEDLKTYLQMYVQVIAEDQGRVESAYESQGGFVGLEFFDSVSPEYIGESAARRVKLLLSAQPAPAGTMPVVLSSSAGGTMIHEAVGHGLEADLACNGLSVYQGKLGQWVAAPGITVLDDGTLPGKRGSFRLDDEGSPSQSTVLIERGILKSYLVDRLSATKFGLALTGNGRRESFRHKPIVRMTNTYIASGSDQPEQILKETLWGIFVKAMGGGQVNTVTGDFVFAVTEGYLIHQGQLGAPIRGATLVGNGPRVLLTVDRIGNDLGFATGTCGKDGQAAPVTDAQPTLRIPELIVGGEVSLEHYWPLEETLIQP